MSVFSNVIKPQGLEPLQFPTKFRSHSIDQARSRAGQRHRYAPLLEHFDSQGYRYIDALDALTPHESRYTSADFTADEYGHLSAIAHELVAALIYEQLEAWQFTDPAHLQDAIRMERDRFGVGH